jgi:hypothetical protein
MNFFKRIYGIFMRFTLIYFLSFANQRKKRTRSMTCPNLGGHIANGFLLLCVVMVAVATHGKADFLMKAKN